jgi:UDP-glucose 4-epimerase
VRLDGLRILLTGGAGFIGSHIARDLVAAGAHVRVYDDFSSGHRDNLRDVESQVEIVEADILDADALLRAAEDVDVISHQAAQLEIIRCIENPGADLRSNAQGSLNVLEAARRARVPRVVYASSACVYGQAAYVPQDEHHPTAPNWPYGVSKLAAEHYARLYADYYGVRTIGLRYSIVYGPHEWFGRVLTVFLKRAFERQPPVVWGGSQRRDFVFVQDVVELHRRCLVDDSLSCELFNVSTGVGTSIRELACLICRQFDLREPVYEETAPGEPSALVTDRIRLPAELETMVLSPAKAGRRLGWTPKVPLADGLRAEADWLSQGGLDGWRTMHY